MAEFELTEAQVNAARAAVCAEAQKGRRRKVEWGRGDFGNAVFEQLVDEFGLPLKTIEIGQIPDFDDPRVKALNSKLAEFSTILDKGCNDLPQS